MGSTAPPGQSLLQADEQLNGRILLWHGWQGNDEAVLNEVLDNFSEIYPEVSIKTVAVDPELLLENYLTAAAGGLGPDLLIGPGTWLAELSSSGLIGNIGPPLNNRLRESTDRSVFLDSAFRYLGDSDRLYGLPLALDTLALYYNRQVVTTPPSTTEQLLAELDRGAVLAMGSSFTDLFWGVQAFGGRLTDDEGRIILDQGGFANWLAWLKQASSTPGLILDSNRTDLRNRFADGGADYYVGSAKDYQPIVDQLGRENVGVTFLPEGPLGKSAPFLDIDALYFNRSSSTIQRQLAIEVALFMTNAKQQEIFMRSARHIPVNGTVRPNPRLDTVVNSFFIQSLNSIFLPSSVSLSQSSGVTGGADSMVALSQPDAAKQMAELLAIGDAVIGSVLAGEVLPTDAAYGLTERLNQTLGIEVALAEPSSCPELGQIDLLYPMQDELTSALQMLRARYRQICPFIIIRLLPTEVSLFSEAYVAAAEGIASEIGMADLFIAPHTLMPYLSGNGLIVPISSNQDGELLQRYRPITLDAVRRDNQLYGLPLSLHLNVLYYNASLVDSPAPSLDAFSSQMERNGERQATIGIPTQFLESYWGVTVFGGKLFTNGVAIDGLTVPQLAMNLDGSVAQADDGGSSNQMESSGTITKGMQSGVDANDDAEVNATTSTAPLVAWLSWLKEREQFGTVIAHQNQALLFNLFLQEELTYLVAGPELLIDYQRRLKAGAAEELIKKEALRATLLPSGVAGEASPFLSIDALFLNASSDEGTRTQALNFARFMTEVDSQILLLDVANRIPVNANVPLENNQIAKAFIEQRSTAQLLPDMEQMVAVRAYGDTLMQQALQSNQSLTEIVQKAIAQIKQAYGE